MFPFCISECPEDGEVASLGVGHVGSGDGVPNSTRSTVRTGNQLGDGLGHREPGARGAFAGAARALPAGDSPRDAELRCRSGETVPGSVGQPVIVDRHLANTERHTDSRIIVDAVGNFLPARQQIVLMISIVMR